MSLLKGLRLLLSGGKKIRRLQRFFVKTTLMKENPNVICLRRISSKMPVTGNFGISFDGTIKVSICKVVQLMKFSQRRQSVAGPWKTSFIWTWQFDRVGGWSASIASVVLADGTGWRHVSAHGARCRSSGRCDEAAPSALSV
jgi:hypothetical protein